jgi:heptaprenylglyceryl phosphate synthase
MANRETKFDPDRAKSILADLATGNTRACAAGRAGVTDRTLRNWIARGKRGKKPFVSFVSAVKKAERDAEAFAVRSIVAAGRKNWTAHAWWLPGGSSANSPRTGPPTGPRCGRCGRTFRRCWLSYGT